jgi:DNA-binding winged helix-turn-helix (wHTH) protein
MRMSKEGSDPMVTALEELDVQSVSFGQFCLYPTARVLHRGGAPVELGSRALDLLIALVERAGEVVDHRELIARAWRGLVVESGNLRVQMSYLRRCLGDGEQGARYIANVPGQGYSFVAPVRRPDSHQRQRLKQECSRNRRIIQQETSVTTMIG